MDFEPFLEYLVVNRVCSSQAILAYRSALSLFKSYLRERSITTFSEVDHSIIREYTSYICRTGGRSFDGAERPRMSIASHLAAVSCYAEFARGARPNLRNPINYLSRRSKATIDPNGANDPIPAPLISDMTSIRNRMLFALYVAGDLRISELRLLNRDSILVATRVDQSGDEHLIGYGEVVGKSDKRRKFCIDEATLYLYCEYLGTRTDDTPALFLSERNQRLSARSMQYILAACREKLGASSLKGPHSGRPCTVQSPGR